MSSCPRVPCQPRVGPDPNPPANFIVEFRTTDALVIWPARLPFVSFAYDQAMWLIPATPLLPLGMCLLCPGFAQAMTSPVSAGYWLVSAGYWPVPRPGRTLVVPR